LIESVLVETSEIDIEVDTLKIETLLPLFHKNEIFPNSEDLMEVYRDQPPSISEPWHFFPVLQGYLFDIGKMLVEEFQHDFLIDKEFGGDIRLTPTQDYDEIYEYFQKRRKINNIQGIFPVERISHGCSLRKGLKV
jgi:hypothetical protein